MAEDRTTALYCNDARLQLPEEEIYKVELMYSSRNSQAFVCPCLANLYEYGRSERIAGDNWNLLTTGIPLLVVESTADAHHPPRLYIRVAELGTGFTLWKQPVSSFTRYCAVDSSFHTFFISTAADCRTVGISFDHSPSARKFYQQLRSLQGDISRKSKGMQETIDDIPANQTLHTMRYGGPESNKSAAPPLSSVRMRRTKTAAPTSKSSISGPCCFKHITCLRPGDLITSYDALTSSLVSSVPRENATGATLRRTLDRGSRSFTNLCESRNVIYD